MQRISRGEQILTRAVVLVAILVTLWLFGLFKSIAVSTDPLLIEEDRAFAMMSASAYKRADRPH